LYWENFLFKILKCSLNALHPVDNEINWHMIHFFLAPDISSSLALKRKLAEQVPGCGVIAGGWFELLGLIRNAFLLPHTTDRWQTHLETAIKTSKDSFWCTSLEAVPAEGPAIFSIIDRTLTMLLEGIGPLRNLEEIVSCPPSDRATQHLNDLSKLHQSMEGALPPHLELIAQVLDCPPGCQLRNIYVYHRPGWPDLDPWQQALVARLNESSPSDSRYTELFSEFVFSAAAPESSALGVVQRHLFQAVKNRVRQDDTVQYLAVRDHIQEAEIAAGMIQQALRDNPKLRLADLALLLPTDQRYNSSVRDVFAFAGLPLSGLRTANILRNIGCETVRLLLLCMNKPAPLLALTSFLVSPLMPWETSRGYQLAQQVMQGAFDLREWEGCGEGTRLILAAVRTPPGSSNELARELKRISLHLNPSVCLEVHCSRAVATLKRIISTLNTAGLEIPWNELHSLCASESLPVAPPVSTREGIAIFHEGEEPWRQVRHLWVLGCCEGHYPASISRSPVFSENDLKRLRDQGGLAIISSTEQGQQLRELFRRQLCSTSDTATFLIPRRTPLGNPLSPSQAITFMASQFLGENGQPIDQKTMILELETARGRIAARGIAMAPVARPTPPRAPIAADLCLSRNLLEIGMGKDARLKPESPSRLEILMVSPLAWLFERLGVTARDWVPETLDVMTKGTLAHAVFEHLFAPGVSLPGLASIQANVPSLLAQAIRDHCPFLQRSEWIVEREQLQQEILRAAQRWTEILAMAQAEVLATEIGLQGVLDDVPIHGNADLLLALPGKRLYVVDYKKSSSGNRWRRMNRGYDHQAALYRTMIQTGGLKRSGNVPLGLAEKLVAYRDSGEIGAMYFLMNDQNVLTDTKGWLPKGIGGAQEMGDAIAEASMNLIRSRFAELKDGRVILNQPGDEIEFKDNRGITPYALDSSPLLRIFMKKNSPSEDGRDV